MLFFAFALFWFCIALGVLLAVWMLRRSERRGVRQDRAEIGCLGCLFGGGIFVVVGILWLAVFLLLE